MTTIATTRFGLVDVKDDQVITFTDGMIGFSKLKHYVLVESPAMPLVLWLQSMDRSDVAFPLIEPWFFRKDYRLVMSDPDRIALKLSDADFTKILLVMTIPEQADRMTVNLKAPIVLNLSGSTAAQVIQQDRTYEIRVPAHEAFSQAMAALADFGNDQASDQEEWVTVDLKNPKLCEVESAV
jgi:flagellar assembly factor FliW